MKGFWRRIKKTDSCWLWTGYISDKGYGQFSSKGKTIRAHRLAYELLVGKIPHGYQLDHLCRVRNCVNPAHLEPVTQKENIRRGYSPSAVNKRKLFCCNGHEYTESNTHVVKTTGARMCRQCHSLADAKFYKRHKEKILCRQRAYYRRKIAATEEKHEG